MFKNKKDPLANIIEGIMNRTALRNKVEEALNEQLGVSSRKGIPHEYLAQYDAMLLEALRNKTLDEQQLQEKATNPQQEKVARVMREYKEGKLHSGSEKGPKVTKNTLNEEIKNNLLEKLNFVYENYGEQAAQYAYDTLNEEERGILSEFWDRISSLFRGSPVTTGPSGRNAPPPRPAPPQAASTAASTAAQSPGGSPQTKSGPEDYAPGGLPGQEGGPEIPPSPAPPQAASTAASTAAPAVPAGGSSAPTATSRPGGSLERVGSTSIARRPSGGVSSTYTPRSGPERDWKKAAFNPDTGA